MIHPSREKMNVTKPLPPMPVVRAVMFVSDWLHRVRRKVLPAPLALVEMTSAAHMVSNGIFAVTRLGIADRLADGPRRCEDLASAVGAEPSALFRLMRALASAGVFDQVSEDGFALNDISRCLVANTPGSLHALMLLASEPWHHQLWGELAETVRTGRPSHERALGMPLFEYLGRHAEQNDTFNRAMIDYSAQTAAAFVASYDLSDVGTLVDVAGGYGQLLAAALGRYPSLRGVLFDQPHVVEGARARIAAAGLADRVEITHGDMFARIPPCGDAYVLMNILHDWGDDDAVAILRRCCEAMRGRGRLAVVEMVIPPNGEAYFGTLFDLEMMVLFQKGRERTEREICSLFDAAGLRFTRRLATPSNSFVLEAVAR